jgi:hypothetical protein
MHGHFHAVIHSFESESLLVLVCRGRHPNHLSLIQVHRPLLGGFPSCGRPFYFREHAVLILSCTQHVVRDRLSILQRILLD